MGLNSNYPVTPRLGPISLCSVTASQSAITDWSLQPLITPYHLPDEPNNLELQFFAKHGTNDPENQTSAFEIYGWPEVLRSNGDFHPTLLLGDITVTWAVKKMTLNPWTQATEDWAEGDAFTLTTYRRITAVGNETNDRGQRLSIDMAGLGYILVVCNDIDPGTTINEVRVLGRPF